VEGRPLPGPTEDVVDDVPGTQRGQRRRELGDDGQRPLLRRRRDVIEGCHSGWWTDVVLVVVGVVCRGTS